MLNFLESFRWAKILETTLQNKWTLLITNEMIRLKWFCLIARLLFAEEIIFKAKEVHKKALETAFGGYSHSQSYYSLLPPAKSCTILLSEVSLLFISCSRYQKSYLFKKSIYCVQPWERLVDFFLIPSLFMRLLQYPNHWNFDASKQRLEVPLKFGLIPNLSMLWHWHMQFSYELLGRKENDCYDWRDAHTFLLFLSF